MPPQGAKGGVGDLGVVTLVVRSQLDVQVERDAAHAGHAAHRPFHGMLLPECVEVAGQRDNAVLDHHADRCRVDGRIPGEFGCDVALELSIAFHVALLGMWVHAGPMRRGFQS